MAFENERIEEILMDAEERMEKSVSVLKSEYAVIRAVGNAIGAALKQRNRDSRMTEEPQTRSSVFAHMPDGTVPLHLVLDGAAYGTGGAALYRALLEHGAAAEKFDERYVVFIVTHYDTADDIRRLGKILKEVL